MRLLLLRKKSIDANMVINNALNVTVPNSICSKPVYLKEPSRSVVMTKLSKKG